MTDARQIQLQLLARPAWPASLRTLELSGPRYLPARTVFSASSPCSVDVLQERCIGSNLFENQSSDRQILSVGHVQFPSDEVQQNTSEFQGAGETHRKLGKSFQGQSYLYA